jgi:ABC-type multidrug transport system permease subunit
MQPIDRERALLTWSGVSAVIAVCAIFLASVLQENLLGWIIGTGVFLPILGTAVLVRGIIWIIVFFWSQRPPETRTIRAFFGRDKWLVDRLRASQPRSFVVVGASLVFFKLAMLGAIILAALCVFAHVMLLQQAVSMFVVGTILSIGYQAIVGSFLSLRQLHTLRTATHL